MTRRHARVARVLRMQTISVGIFVAGLLNAALRRQWSSDEAMFNLHELPRACHPQITIKTQSHAGLRYSYSRPRVSPAHRLAKLDTFVSVRHSCAAQSKLDRASRSSDKTMLGFGKSR